MALGDGITWDETTPTDATVAVQIDDYNRDLRKGVRGRMASEHEWPASQAATAEGGRHKYISFQSQASLPVAAISGTQVAGVYVKTQNLFYVNTNSDEVQIVAGTAVGDGKILANGTDAAAGYLTDKLDSTYLTISGTNLLFSTNAIEIYRYSSVSASTRQNAQSLKMCYGGFTLGGGVGASTNITNLPFADGTSYGINVSFGVMNTPTEALVASRINGNTVTVWKTDNLTQTVNWVAIGV